MGSKIVSLGSTIFMLSICAVVILTMNYTQRQSKMELSSARAVSSVIMTDGEVRNSGEVRLRGSSVISCIRGLDDIDSKISDHKEKVFLYTTDNGTKQSRYVVNFNGETNRKNIINLIQPNSYYTMTYAFGTRVTTVTIKQTT